MAAKRTLEYMRWAVLRNRRELEVKVISNREVFLISTGIESRETLS